MTLPKPNIKFILIFTLIGGSIGLFFLQRKTAQNTPKPPNAAEISKLPIEAIDNEPQTVDFSIKISSQPTSSEIFEYTTSAPTDSPTWLPSLLGFEPKDYDPTMSQWFSPTIGRMGMYPSIHYFYFQPTTGTNSAAAAALPFKTADQIAQDIFKQYQLSSSTQQLALMDGQYLYSDGYNPKVMSSAQEASQTKLYYAYMLDSLPLFVATKPLSSATLTLDGNKKITNLTYYQMPIISTKTPTTPISPETAAELLRQNKGTLIEASSPQLTEITPELIFSRASITKSNLVYIYIESAQRIIPAYLLQGTAPSTTSNKLVYNVRYLVPAVK